MKSTLSTLADLPKGYRAYNIAGVDQLIIARKGGPSAEDVKNKPTYEKLRKNQKEFGVASMVAKVLRNTFADEMSEICETYVSGRLTAQFRNLTKLETGETGKRPFIFSKHGHLLSGFEFNTTAPYEEIFGAKYYIHAGSRRGQVILHFPAFIPEKTFKKPEGATNFKIFARLVAIADHQYSQEMECYIPSNDQVHGKFGAYQSPMLPILKISTEPMTGQVSVDVKEMGDGVALFLIMAVSFYRYENGRFHQLSRDSAMTIKQVY